MSNVLGILNIIDIMLSFSKNMIAINMAAIIIVINSNFYRVNLEEKFIGTIRVVEEKRYYNECRSLVD